MRAVTFALLAPMALFLQVGTSSATKRAAQKQSMNSAEDGGSHIGAGNMVPNPGLRQRRRANVVDSTGTIKKVPGYPAGTELKYRMGAVKTGKRSSHFWLQIKNENAFDVNIIVCAMINLKKPETVPDVDYKIKKTQVEGEEKWTCEKETPDPGDGPNSYHFGCKRITIKAGKQADAFDAVAEFASDVSDATGKSLLGTVYFDILKDCALTKECDDLVGARKFLSPDTPAGHDDWANVWAGGKKYEDLTGSGLTKEDWPTGNWVTMDKNETRSFPSRLTGTVSGAPRGSIIDIFINDTLTQSYVVEPDQENPPCGGRDVEVNLPFILPPSRVIHDGLSVSMPANDCGYLQEGTVTRFNAIVTAEPGAPIYSDGDFMYGIDLVFVRDTVPPEQLQTHIGQSGSSLHVQVNATDETTLVVGATLIFVVGGGEEMEHPINYGIPAEDGDVMLFEDYIEGLPTNVPIEYWVVIYDEVGNSATGPTGIIELVPFECPVTPGCCEHDCCGAGTEYDAAAGLCMANPSSQGFSGVYPPGHSFGCVERACCEEDCCEGGTSWVEAVAFCVA